MSAALIVDDSPFLALHLAGLLTAQGLQPHILLNMHSNLHSDLHTNEAADTSDLHALAARAAVIFVELELFQANGFAVTRELAGQCSCPLVLLTGTGRNTDLQWGLRAGASAVLRRPVTAPALQAVLQKVLSTPACGAA